MTAAWEGELAGRWGVALLHRAPGVRCLGEHVGHAHVVGAFERGKQRFIVAGVYAPIGHDSLPVRFSEWFS